MRVGFFKGEEMHSRWDGSKNTQYFWKFPSDFDQVFDPEAIYTVVYNFNIWESDSLQGSNSNIEYIPLSVEKTPDYIIRAQSILEDYKLLKEKEIEYRRSVQTIKEYEAQKQKCDDNESKCEAQKQKCDDNESKSTK